MLDADLAKLYGVSVGRLNEAVRRNIDRFPDDFIFQLTREEFEDLRSQTVASNLKSQIAISSSGWGGRRASTIHDQRLVPRPGHIFDSALSPGPTLHSRGFLFGVILWPA